LSIERWTPGQRILDQGVEVLLERAPCDRGGARSPVGAELTAHFSTAIR